jgi:hypothetical protein
VVVDHDLPQAHRRAHAVALFVEEPAGGILAHLRALGGVAGEQQRQPLAAEGRGLGLEAPQLREVVRVAVESLGERALGG